MDTRKRPITLLMATLLAISACTAQSAGIARRRAPQAPAPSTDASTAPSDGRRHRSPRSPLAADPAEAVIQNVEAERRDRHLDVLAVADVRQLDQGHDHPVRGDVPGRQGQLGRPPGDVPGRPQEPVRGRQRAGRDQPVGR